MLVNNLVDLIGQTPMMPLRSFESGEGARIFGKLEMLNPGFSLKDRIALAMIEQAEQDGRLKPGGTLIEPTSGNTGISLAWISAVKGYHLILTMPERLSQERLRILTTLGAEVVLTPWQQGMNGALKKAQELLEEREGAVLLQQFRNPANPETHYNTTGPEIWSDMGGDLDVFIAGAGTGGTLHGIGRYLKEQNPDIQIWAVEPSDSPVLSGGTAGPHKLQGIGPGFVPVNYNADVVDRIVPVEYKDAVQAVKTVARHDGLLVGLSGGANLHVASTLAQDSSWSGKRVVAFLCDTGERYLSLPDFKPRL